MSETTDAPILCCAGCGRTKPRPDGDITDAIPAVQCEECPPRTCDRCGQIDSTVKHCSCWTMVADMSEAEFAEAFGEPAPNVISLSWARSHQKGSPS